MGLWRDVRQFPTSIRLLFVNQFTINAGFYMLMPYLADYLANDLALAGWAVGLILGVRNLGQQGMFFFGGALADRFGYKPLIVAGCTLRTVGFGLLAFAAAIPVLLVASALIGLAGALFNPAVRAYVAHDAGERRVEAFATFNVFYQAGLLAGPLIGLGLLLVDFRLVCAVAAVLFAVLSAVQVRALPHRKPEHLTSEAGQEHAAGMRSGWRLAVRNRSFVVFSIVMAGAMLLTFQTYLILPLQLRDVAASRDAAGLWTAALFAVSGLVAVVAQRPVTSWTKRRWPPQRALSFGLALAGLAFLPLSLSAGWGGSALVIGSVLLAGLALGIASAVTYPFEMDGIVSLAGNRFVATHYGVYSTIGGVAVAGGNLALGAVIDLTNPALSAFLLVVLGLGCAAALRSFRGFRKLSPPLPATKPVAVGSG